MVQAQVKEATPGTIRGFQPPREVGPFWAALTDDTNLPVFVIDNIGTIEFANDTAMRSMDLPTGASVVGRSLKDFYNEEIVRDRLTLINDHMSQGKSVTVVGMCKGRLMRTTFRPVAAGPGRPRILVTSRLAAASDETGNGVIRARIEDPGKLGGLTARELEILKLIGMGLSSADIAKRLGRSVKTVEWHRVSLGDKLGVGNRVELARIAIAAGIVSADQPGEGLAADEE